MHEFCCCHSRLDLGPTRNLELQNGNISENSRTVIGKDFQKVNQPVRTRRGKNLSRIQVIEQFSIECRKTKTKVITTANQNKDKYHNEPMRTQSKYR